MFFLKIKKSLELESEPYAIWRILNNAKTLEAKLDAWKNIEIFETVHLTILLENRGRNQTTKSQVYKSNRQASAGKNAWPWLLVLLIIFYCTLFWKKQTNLIIQA